MVAWSDLDEVEQKVMMMASEEAPLWEFCLTSQMGDGPIQPAIGVEVGQATVQRLLDLGLVRLFRLADPDADMSETEVAGILASTEAWVPETGPRVWVSLYLTPVGEALYYDDKGT